MKKAKYILVAVLLITMLTGCAPRNDMITEENRITHGQNDLTPGITDNTREDEIINGGNVTGSNENADPALEDVPNDMIENRDGRAGVIIGAADNAATAAENNTKNDLERSREGR